MDGNCVLKVITELQYRSCESKYEGLGSKKKG